MFTIRYSFYIEQFLGDITFPGRGSFRRVAKSPSDRVALPAPQLVDCPEVIDGRTDRLQSHDHFLLDPLANMPFPGFGAFSRCSTLDRISGMTFRSKAP